MLVFANVNKHYENMKNVNVLILENIGKLSFPHLFILHMYCCGLALIIT